MLRIQETKKDLAQAALGEGDAVKLHKLSVKELKAVRYIPYLFHIPSDLLLSFGTVVRNESKRGPQTGSVGVLNRALESCVMFNSVRL